MSVTLTQKVEEEVQQLIESGRYPDADAVVQTALQALKDQEEAKLAKLRELVRAGFESGNYRELTPELMDEIERRAEERFQRGEKPGPHVCP
jgi:putative addiction module CopG family antidote